MNHHYYFNQIQLSSVNPVYDEQEANQEEQDSIINELDYFCAHDEDESPIVKIQSFLYAEEVKNSINQEVRRDLQLLQGSSQQKEGRYAGYRFQESVLQSKQYKNNKQSKIDNQNIKRGNHYKKSIKEQLMEQNKLLEQKLKANKHTHRVYESLAPPQQLFRNTSNQQEKRESANNKIETKASTFYNQNILKMEEQYTNSSTIKFYNFIMKELPQCDKCHSVRTHIVEKQHSTKLICKKCENVNEEQVFHPFIGILYDLQTKIRFQQDLQLSQSILEGFNRQIENLKKEIQKIESIKDKITHIKNTNRKKYKQLNQVKYFIKKNLSKLNTQHILQLQGKIPCEYLQQVEKWRQIDQMYEDKWKHIYSSIYRLMPIYLHDHDQSKILSGLYKILNYQKNQEVKLSVSQHIKFPIKQMDSVVFMVDGTYNLPIFENIKHLQMEFQHKKTQRELNLLFSNLPRQIYSLGFKFNHKMHSHISAQNFPFLKYIAPVVSIKKLNLKIENVKDYGDLLRLPQLMTQKIEFRLTITKHLFIKEELNLPQNYYEKLLEKLGQKLVVFELRIPQGIDSMAKINYEKVIEKKKLCFYVLERGQKQKSKGKNVRILQSLNEQAMLLAKRKENASKKVIFQRNKLVKIIKSMVSQKINHKQLVLDSVISLL